MGVTLLARRDQVMLRAGFAAALRRFELAAVRAERLSYMPDGLHLLIRKSRSDQEVAGVAYGSRSETCPIRAVRSYVTVASRALADQERPPPSPGPYFAASTVGGGSAAARSPGGAWPTSSGGAPTEVGSDLELYAGHSLRAGFATSAARGQARPSNLEADRHKNAATLAEYISEARLFDDNASEGIGL